MIAPDALKDRAIELLALCEVNEEASDYKIRHLKHATRFFCGALGLFAALALMIGIYSFAH